MSQEPHSSGSPKPEQPLPGDAKKSNSLSEEFARNLRSAAERDDVEELERLLETLVSEENAHIRSNVNLMAAKHEVLEIAAKKGYERVMELLLKNGVKCDARLYGGLTALHLAARGGHVKIVGTLLEKGADITARDMLGKTVLYHAVTKGREDVVRLLLAKRAQSQVVDRRVFHGTVLHRAISKGNVSIMAILLEDDADVSVRSQYGYTPLMVALASPYLQTAKLLLSSGKNLALEARNPENGCTALHVAVCEALWAAGRTDTDLPPYSNYLEMVKLLLEKGAKVDAQKNFDPTPRIPRDMMYEAVTPLHMAAIRGNVEIAELLLAKGADVDFPNEINKTALMFAISCGHRDLAFMLVRDYGADIEAQDSYGFGVLSYAGGLAEGGVRLLWAQLQNFQAQYVFKTILPNIISPHLALIFPPVLTQIVMDYYVSDGTFKEFESHNESAQKEFYPAVRKLIDAGEKEEKELARGLSKSLSQENPLSYATAVRKTHIFLEQQKKLM